jgi:hypothetical protein
MRVIIASMSSAILDCLAHPGSLGVVHSVFDHAVNIHLSDSPRIITLTFMSAGGLPYALMLAEGSPASFLSSGIVVGKTVELTEGSCLKIEDARDWYDFSDASTWNPVMVKLSAPADDLAFGELLDWAAGYIYERANHAGLVPLLKEPHQLFDGIITLDNVPDLRVASLAVPYVNGLLNALRQNDAAVMNAAMTSLIGYGIGGTPSGDDLLVGLLAALKRSSLPRANRLLQLLSTTLSSQLDNKATSLLSLTVLRHALAGEFSEKIHLVTQQLMHPDDIKSLEASLQKLLLHGATSGSEMFLGVYLGFMLLQDA